MAKKQFKTESKRILDLMINSIYTHKEIFLRELISNASDALDKLAYKSLTDDGVGLSRSDFKIHLAVDKDARTLTISDNGIGMTQEELENNLGVIARSGSLQFKEEMAKAEGADTADTDIIGQFGVGFYSAFMVADHITVTSRATGRKEPPGWRSNLRRRHSGLCTIGMEHRPLYCPPGRTAGAPPWAPWSRCAETPPPPTTGRRTGPVCTGPTSAWTRRTQTRKCKKIMNALAFFGPVRYDSVSTQDI